MENINELIEGLVFTNPSLLPSVINNYEKVCEHYLPVSVGIEIESVISKSNNLQLFKDKVQNYNLLDLNLSVSEQRFRIDKGYKGLISLYDTLEVFKELVDFNPLSGIHVHLDLTKYWNNLNRLEFIKKHEEEILNSLDSWEYKGGYNRRTISNGGKGVWLSFREHFKTLECRIIEMTFDYTLLFKRIHDLCYIILPKIIYFSDVDNIFKEYEELSKVDIYPSNLLNSSIETLALNTIKTRTIKL